MSLTLEKPSVTEALTPCAHCGLPAIAGRRFCCPGCEAAYCVIQTLGFGRYYQQRLLDPTLRPPKPEPKEPKNVTRHITDNPDGTHSLALAVDGIQCGACVWLIEEILARDPGVIAARVNMTTRRLSLTWRDTDPNILIQSIESLGYRLVPFETGVLARAQDATGRALLGALAVAGFAAGNVMLISIGIWAGETSADAIGPATISLLHWVSALIAMPAIAYAGLPFFTSAARALIHRRTNMDVPISVGVLLVTIMSLTETIEGGEQTYFDSAITLLFFLLVGRVLDHRARGRARASAEQLLALRATEVAIVQSDGTIRRRPQDQVATDDRILVTSGERIGVDGVVERGTALLDASLVTGESLPIEATPGAAVFAGTLNLGMALTIRATATGDATLLAECVRLIEAAEQRRGRFVVLADRVARRYAPAVHLAALLTFLWWYVVLGVSAGRALLTACAVLIITCPCALALAVPAVQVIAAGRLFRRGILLKSPTALERLADIDSVVFDKTGTLTNPLLTLSSSPDPQALRIAASLAVTSRHPLSRSLVAAAGPVSPAANVDEHPGQGLLCRTPDGDIRLGSAAFCGLPTEAGATLVLTSPHHPPTRFSFAETPRPDAAATIAALRDMGLRVTLLSGDHAAQVAAIAAQLALPDWQAGCSPLDKIAHIEALRAAGHKVLMVGDGLNDAPALAAATISASPADAADVSQTVADLVFQGANLAPIALAISTARRARNAMRQNLVFSIGYNIVMVPLAMAGCVTPWLAAAAMSGSSLLVMANSLRLKK